MVKIFTMVKGEADIVEDWVKYHGVLFGFQNLFIIDNMSLDGTYEILSRLKNTYNINIFRAKDYSKKGVYMTNFLRKYGNNDVVFPIDIDEFIAYYDKKTNTLTADYHVINNYINSLPSFPIFKMNYIQSKMLNPDGYKRAAVECSFGYYDDRGNHAKTFFKSNLFKGVIDHGNHYMTDKYILTKLCLVHFHTRNMDQIKKKVYNNVRGFKYNPFDVNHLKNILSINPVTEGNHHISKQISILENTFNIPVEEQHPNDICLTPLNDFIRYI